MKNRNLYKIAMEGFGLAGCLLLVCSCLSFDIGDWPSDYVWPPNDPVANWCGSIGAFFAYYTMYYTGPGVFVLLVAATLALVLGLMEIKITQPMLRATGLILLVVGVSSGVYLFHSYSADGFPIGNGGVLGVAVGSFLRGHVAILGTSIIIGCFLLVGAILLADRIVLALIRGFGFGVSRLFGLAVPAWSAARQHSRQMGQIWKRLNERQKEQSDKLRVTLRKKAVEAKRLAKERRIAAKYEKAERQNVVIEEVKSAKTDKGKSPKPEAAKEAEDEVLRGGGNEAYEDYKLPPLELLCTPEYGFAAIQGKMVERKAEALENLLGEFGISARIVNAEPGPAITMYELELAPGIKVSQISNLANDMARALGAGSVRVVAPLPGRHTIGIEAPNSQRETVRMKELLQRAGSKAERMAIPLFLGKSSSGEVLLTDLAEMPHLLIAGTTGSGKSVCINSIIAGILLTKRPDEVKLILVDPKMVEMVMFEQVPHLMCPIVTETKRAEQILEWATTKMDERYELLAEARVRNIASYNKLGAEKIIERFQPSTPEEEAKIPKKMPHIVIIIDELADLMMTAGKEIEAYIVRLAQKSRAVGIHLIVATQRPQATVVTGLIKSNMPARIGFRVAAKMDSRIILDQNGGETLLGEGDMLFLRPGTSDLLRAQGTFVDDQEIKKIIKYLKEVAEPSFHPELMQLNRVDVSMMNRDDLFDEAVRVVLETKRGSVSLLQRRLTIGYARASRIIEMMAASGLLGEYKGSQAREVTMTLEEYERAKEQMATDAAAGYEDLNEDEDDEVAEEEYEDAVVSDGGDDEYDDQAG